MSGTPVSGDEKVIETWQIVSEGTCWVWVYDKRDDRYKKQRVGGRQGGSKTLHISTDDRRFNQEQVVEEMKTHDPFVNGMLRLVSRETVAEDIDTTYHLTAEDLKAMLKVEDKNLFEEEITSIKSELVLRRLFAVCEEHGTVSQLNFIRDLIEGQYKVGGTQKSVREMIAAGEQLSGTILS